MYSPIYGNDAIKILFNMNAFSNLFLALTLIIRGMYIVHLILYSTLIIKKRSRTTMKGYNTENGYMGYVDDEYQLFASEADYREWMED